MGKGRLSMANAEFDSQSEEILKWMGETKTGQTLDNATLNGILTTEVSQGIAIRLKWRNTQTSPGVYDLQLKKETKTAITTQLCRDVKREFRNWALPILDRLAVNPNFTNDDRIRLRIAIPKGTRTKRTIPIAARTFLRWKPVGSGKLILSTFTNAEAKRPSLDPLASGVRIGIVIVDPNYVDGSETTGILKKLPPASAAKCTYRENHSRASFELAFSEDYSGLAIYIYAQQWDERHPNLAGPWSDVLAIHVP